ncbi:unnamed protein product, partial [marine sediment metagenome]
MVVTEDREFICYLVCINSEFVQGKVILVNNARRVSVLGKLNSSAGTLTVLLKVPLVAGLN